jgi:hypothetical protein
MNYDEESSIAQKPRKKYCPICYDLPHRRPKDELCICGKNYEEEKVIIQVYGNVVDKDRDIIY